MSQYLRGATLAVACLLFSPSAYAHHTSAGGTSGASSGPISTLSAGTLKAGHLSVGLDNEFVRAKPFSDAELISLASRHVHAHSADWTMQTSLGIGFGVTDDFMLSFTLPYIRRDNIRSGHHSHGGGGVVTNTVDYFGDAQGRGDITVLGKYRVLKGPALEAAVLLGGEIPSGDTGVRNQGATLEAEFQPGSGSWDGLAGFAATRRFGPLSLDASLIYKKSTEGIQRTKLGDSATGGIAASWRVGGDEHHHRNGAGKEFTHLHAAWDFALELTGEWSAKQEEAGTADKNSGGQEYFASPGLRYTAEGGAWSAHASVGIPIDSRLRQGHSETGFRLLTGVGKAF